jgi:hypothetical protein
VYHLRTQGTVARIQSEKLEVHAKVRLSVKAAFTFPARQAWIDRHWLPDPELTLRSWSQSRYSPCRFMSQYQWALRSHTADLAVQVGMQVAAADSHRRHVKQYFAGSRRFVWLVFDAHIAWPI